MANLLSTDKPTEYTARTRGDAVEGFHGAIQANYVDQDTHPDTNLKDNLTNASSINSPPPLATALNLSPHPEGGWFRETWRSTPRFFPDGYQGSRSAATAIYYLLGQDEVSQWHKIYSDEIWMWHRGSSLELILGGRGEFPNTITSIIQLGPSVEEGEHPQALVPGGVWQMARPIHSSDVLVSCVVAPGFDYHDFAVLHK